MAVEVFKLFGSIFVNNDEANKSISKTDEKASSVASTLGKGVQTAAKWGAAVVGGATAAAGGMLKMAESSASTADHVDKMSQKIGISRQAYQELDFICSQTGTSVDKLSTGMKTLRSNMGDSKKAPLFEQLKVDVTDANGAMRDSEAVMWDTMKALQDMGNQTEKEIMAQKLFGKSGTELLPLLNSQAGSIDELKNKAHELGLVMSDELIDSGVGLTDSLDQTKRGFKAMITTLGGAFMPIVQKISDKFQTALPYVQEAITQLEPIVSSFFETMLPVLFQIGGELFPVILTLLQTLFPVLQDLITQILPVFLQLFQQLAPFFVQIVQQVLPLFVQLITALMPFIQQIITQILPVFLQIIQQILPFFVQLATQILPIIIQLVQIILPPILQIVQTVLPLILKLFEAIMPLLSLLAKTILPVIANLLQLAAPIIELLAQLLSGVLGEAITNITNLLKPITDILSGIITFITNVFQGNWEEAWNGIVQAAKGIFNLLPAAIEGIINGIIWVINQMIGGLNWVIQIFGWEIGTIPDVHLPRFRAGIDYVPNDKYLAYLDAGEAVLSASEAEEYRKAKRENGTGSPFKGREEKIINQTFNVNVFVEKINDKFDIDELAVTISQRLAEEVSEREGVYA